MTSTSIQTQNTRKATPFSPSKDIQDMSFTGEYHTYTKADTWYPSWASDGHMYSAFTDGETNGLEVFSFERRSEPSCIGHAKIIGNSPDALEVVEESKTPVALTENYTGRYPCANLFHDDIWYSGTYALGNSDNYSGGQYNWPIMGPFCGFHISKDKGKTWTPSPWSSEIGQTLLSEPKSAKGPIKFGAPHVVDFGCNMEHSPDGKIYMVGHGSDFPDSDERRVSCSWITGDQANLCRVDPSPEKVNDPNAYEYFAGHDAQGQAIWSSSIDDCRPLLEWERHMGCVTITYNAALGKFLMAVTDGRDTTKEMDSYVLEADALTGPYRVIWHQKSFGPQAYFLNFPSRFISEDGKTAWLCLSANFWPCDDPIKDLPEMGVPKGCSYRMSLLEVKFE